MARGLFHIARSGVSLDWPVLGLGAWLVIVVAAGAFAGPRAVWGVYALGAGLAYLVAAAIEPLLRSAAAIEPRLRS